MAKYRYRIEGCNYGGELVIGEVKEEFVKQSVKLDSNDLVERILDADDHGYEDVFDVEEHEDPEQAIIPKEDYYMWECDDVEHLNGPYGDGEFTVHEVPADGSDDYAWEKDVWSGSPIQVYSREAGYFNKDKPEKDVSEYVPVLLFHSSEKGGFGCWFVDTDEEFDYTKLGVGLAETNICDIVDRVYYDKIELETNYDNNDTTGKSYNADVGWLNKKWHDSYLHFDKLDKEYWESFDENAEYERQTENK